MKFGRKGKLGPPHVCSYEFLKRIGKVDYELNLHSELASIHPVFDVSMLKKGIRDPVSILPFEGLGVDENLYYEEVTI